MQKFDSLNYKFANFIYDDKFKLSFANFLLIAYTKLESLKGD